MTLTFPGGRTLISCRFQRLLLFVVVVRQRGASLVSQGPASAFLPGCPPCVAGSSQALAGVGAAGGE